MKGTPTLQQLIPCRHYAGLQGIRWSEVQAVLGFAGSPGRTGGRGSSGTSIACWFDLGFDEAVRDVCGGLHDILVAS